MPSDLAKKKAAKKKEAAKARQRPKKENGELAAEDAEQQPANGTQAADVDEVTQQVEEFELRKADARAVTGVLASHPNSTDVHVINLSLTFHGQELLSDTTSVQRSAHGAEVGTRCRGKSMLLAAVGKREVPIPEHIDIYHLTREMPPSEKTALQCVMEVDTERSML
ncbi:PREDICTED: ATP-binding cassette sub-family F member 2-like, partial [Nanorana parkeri]|uniref:ATP-binding cassette sub-family F member 2-like n=1 Tax=Nanorana parkeri TaxID=125878 RepID=UPI000854D881